MGKEREGKFQTSKGKPSGNGKEIDQQLHLSKPGALENYLELADKYTTGSAEEATNVRIRHPNRGRYYAKPMPSNANSKFHPQ